MKLRFATTSSGVSVLATLLAGPAFAQTESTKLEEVIVTGTFLRGIAPSTVQPIDLDSTAVAATGALSTPQVLANIPQLTDFNSTPAVTGSNNVQVNINRVNLRGLPGSGGGSSTLVLLDGHRLVGAGIKSTAPDSDVLPPSVIERIEAVPDGGSSIYGADAVGGVLNMVPRKRFDGVQFDGHYGTADSYEQFDYGLTAGKDWGSGSAYVAYNHMDHDDIYGRDRDYVKHINWATGLGAEANCSGNVTLLANGARYIVSGNTLAPGRNFCDRSGDRTIYPTEERDTVFASLMQEFGDSITFDMHGYYTQRENLSDEGVRSSSTTIGPVTPLGPNPFFRPAPGAPNPNSSQSVQVLFTSLPTQLDRAENETWGIAPTLTVDFANDWQMRTLLNYGHTTTLVANPQVNAVALGTAAALGQFNPYDVAANNPTLLNTIGNWEIYGRAEHELSDARVVFDGPLMTLPGGEVRVAVGLEYLEEKYEARTGNAVPGQEESMLTLYPSDRHTTSAFAEMNVPLVGESNEVSLVHSLTLSLSARYDDYSDFGDTTNPTFGLKYEPVDWIGIRGRWGTAYQAPSLADTAAADNSITPFPSSIIVNPSQPPTSTQTIELAYQGGLPGIEPQEADVWSIGFDIAPPIVPGLTVSASYYNITYDGIVSIPPVFIPQQFFSQFPDLYVMNPTPQQVTDFINSGPNAAQNMAIVMGRGGPAAVYMLLDARRTNLGSAKVSGIDLAMHYDRDVSYGTIFANLNGTYRLENEQSANAGAPLVSQVDNESRLRSSLSVGTTIGQHLLAQASWLYNSGFDLTPSVQNNFQTEIGSFSTVNLYLNYDVLGNGLLEDLSFSLSVNNVADTDPPEYHGVYQNLTFGYGNGGTVGRLYQLGVTKKF
jgi:iron complex outermembrane recepter protein